MIAIVFCVFFFILDGFFAKTVRFDQTKHYLSVCPTRGKLSLLKFRVIAI